MTDEEEAALDADIEELLKEKNLRGKGLTAGEIARSPEIGIWKDRTAIEDAQVMLRRFAVKPRRD